MALVLVWEAGQKDPGYERRWLTFTGRLVQVGHWSSPLVRSGTIGPSSELASAKRHGSRALQIHGSAEAELCKLEGIFKIK